MSWITIVNDAVPWAWTQCDSITKYENAVTYLEIQITQFEIAITLFQILIKVC